MACELCCRRRIKKISTLVAEHTGSSERKEIRAYEEKPVEKKKYKKDKISELIEGSFPHSDFLYAFYKYMDRFKQEPQSFDDLFEFMDYMKTENRIDEYYRSKNK